MDKKTVFSLLITVLVLEGVTATKATTSDASTTKEATTKTTTEMATAALRQTLFRTLPEKRTTVLHHTSTIMLPDMTTTHIPDRTSTMLPDTTSTLPDATSRMLHITENLTQEPIMSTNGPQQETTTGSTTPAELSCFDVNSHCTLPDGNLSMCSVEVSAKMLCAKTCGYCGNGATSGTCPQGFVPCTDGRCEPYESLCGQFTPNPPPTTTTIMASSTTVTSPTEWTSSSVPTDETITTPSLTSTTYSGPETCPSGFEKCSDGKCEPFHFLCEEHQIGIPAISIVG